MTKQDRVLGMSQKPKCQIKKCLIQAEFRLNRKFLFCRFHYDELFVNSAPDNLIVWITERIEPLQQERI